MSIHAKFKAVVCRYDDPVNIYRVSLISISSDYLIRNYHKASHGGTRQKVNRRLIYFDEGLTLYGRMTPSSVVELVTIDLGICLSAVCDKAITWTIDELLLIGPFEMHFKYY